MTISTNETEILFKKTIKGALLAVGLLALSYFTWSTFAGTTINTALQRANLDDGLVGHWTFDQADTDWASTTAEILDRSGEGNHGDAQSAVSTSSLIFGRIGQAIDLTADNDNDNILVGSSTSVNGIADEITLAGWIKIATSSYYNYIVSNDRDCCGDNNYQGYSLYVVPSGDDNIPRFQIWDSTQTNLQFNANSSLEVGEWYHVVGTYNGSVRRIYINGVLDAESGTGFTGTIGTPASFPLRIGAMGYGGGQYDLLGSLDDVRIYNRALTEREVQQLYHLGGTTKINTSIQRTGLDNGLVGHWTFDAADVDWADTSSEIKDRSGQGNHGNASTTMSSSTASVIGKMGQGLAFDGSDDYVAVSGVSVPDVSSAYTLSVWFKTGSSTAAQRLFSSRATANDGHHLWIQSGEVGFSYYDGSFSSKSTTFTDTTGWHHLVGVHAGGGAVQAYLDGVLLTGATSKGSNIGNAKIGSDAIGTGNFFDGSIDDFRIYDRALTEREVQQLYKMGEGTKVSSSQFFTCGTSQVTDADGNSYDTVLIGTQCWMAQNLNVGTRISGATTQTDNATIEKWCYNNTDANCDSNNNPNYPDGGLYQWDEAMQYSTTPGAQGICPDGWHIPTHDEFTTLERAVCTSGTCATDFPYDTTTTGWRGTDEGTKLKPNGTSGFEGNSAGYGDSGSFNTRGSYGAFWSSLERVGLGTYAWYRTLDSSGAQTFRTWASTASRGYSVRCVMD